MMNNTAYLAVILVLCCILQNVKSRKLITRNGEFKTNSRKDLVDKFDVSKFVDSLIKGAKRMNKEIKAGNTGDGLSRTIHTKKKTDDEIDEIIYDSLGLDEIAKDQIVSSNTPKATRLSLNEMKQLFRASNYVLGETLRSGGGLSLNNVKEQDRKLFRATADESSNKKGGGLIFDLEEDDDVSLKHSDF